MSRVSSSYVARFAQLAALWAYSVGQPVFALLEANPEFLVARGSTKTEIIVFALMIALVPPVAVIGLELLASLVSARLRDLLHLCFIALFTLPLAMLLVSQFDPSALAAVVGAAAMAGAVVFAYIRWRPVRLFLAMSIALPLVGLASFLFGVKLVTEDAEGAHVNVRKPVPVVVLVFDEFPISSIMTSKGTIDGVRYPNFGRLAGMSTWFPRTSSIHEHTTSAVPAIATGQLPREGELPTLADHPQNLFTLLGESYRMHVHEELTYLCPKRYCPRPRAPLRERLVGLFGDVRVAFLHATLPGSLSGGLPEINDRWSGFQNTERLLAATRRADVDAVVDARMGSPAAVDEFVAGLAAHEAPRTLHFAHIMLPHGPWRFLPSGANYGTGETVDGLVGRDEVWLENPWLVSQGYQRHLVQVAYTDTMLGKILDRLERVDILDRALVVVVADHGVSFRTGEPRRHASEGNIADIARVPLFVKLPGQRERRVDRRLARTVDVVPTIVDVLGVRDPWRADGHSLVDAPTYSSRFIAVGKRDGSLIQASVEDIDRSEAATIREKIDVFGEGSRSVFAIGEHRTLLGRRVNAVRVGAGVRVQLEKPERFADVRKSTSFLPARVTGTVEDDLPRGVELAVAINGRIVALTRPFGGDEQRFSALVPESAFREGVNEVRVLALRTSNT